MKSLSSKISLAGMILFLLVTASLLGFSSVMSTAAASTSIDETDTTTTAEDNGGTTASTTLSDNTSLNATTTTSTTIELAEEPFGVGHYRTVSENMITETQVQFSFEGNTAITLPNSTETIMTRDIGEGTFSILPGGGGGSLRGHIHMTTEDGSEAATADFTEFSNFESPTGIGIAYFSTNSTEGMLAPLNNMIAVFLDEEQPNEDIIVRFFEWKSDGGGGGVPIGIDNGATTSDIGNDTTIAAPTTAIETPAVFIP